MTRKQHLFSLINIAQVGTYYKDKIKKYVKHNILPSNVVEYIKTQLQ